MIVTKFKYFLENNLVKKIDMMLLRCSQKNPKRDAVLLCEGEEGQGKTTLSVAIGYYAAEKLGRVFNHTRVFFDLNKMIDFLKNSEEEIAVWDEPALHAMSTDTSTKVVRNLTRLLMMSRKKRHFLIINLAYFNKFNDYVVWQRPLGMIHVYSRNEIQAGRFIYIKKRKLEYLWQDWRRFRKRNYKKWSAKRIRGTFPDVMNPDYKNNVLSDFDIKFYESEKDKAIAMIGSESEKGKKDLKFLALKYLVAMVPMRTQDKKKCFNISSVTLFKWKRLPEKYPEIIDIIKEKSKEAVKYYPLVN